MAQPHIQSGESVSLLSTPIPAARRTHALLKARQLEMVHLVLHAGEQMPMHAAPGEITLYGIEGEMTLSFQGRCVDLGPGSLVHLAAGVPHAVVAVTDATALLTICLIRPGVEAAGPTPSNLTTH